MVTSQPEFSPEELHELLSGVMPEIPGYRVLRLIGRGGMSYVYLGVQKSLDRQVAIKVIAPEALKDEISKLRFEKEARTIARLQHPCIVGIYEVGRTEHGLLYYVLPYLAKGHLGQRDLRGNEARIIEVLRTLLWALDYAHSRGVVHRDVKSENVLFDNADRPLLTDFGIALSKRDRSRVTGRGFAVGSGAHMPPEQARGESVDGRADLYSLGVLTFEMLSGRLPYSNADPLGLALMHAVDPIPRLPAERKHWQPLVDKAMAKLPTDRFADAQEMMAALDKVDIAIDKQSRLLTRDLRPHIAPTWQRCKQWLWLQAAKLNDQRLRILGQHDWLQRRSTLLAGATALVVMLLAGIWLSRPSAPIGETPAAAEAAKPTLTSPQPVAIAATPATDERLDFDTQGDEPTLADALLQPPSEAVVAPLPPGEAALQNAAEQINRRRLTQPPGDNAYESLLTAHSLIPESTELVVLGQRWLQTATPYALQAANENRLDAAKSLLDRGEKLSSTLLTQRPEALTAMREAIAAPLRQSMEQALAGKDLQALRAAKARAEELGLAPSLFQPFWSQAIVSRKLGDHLGGSKVPWVLVRMPTAQQPGLAMLQRPVSRGEYLEFAAASKRSPANCRIRTAMLTLKKRSVSEPGFTQQGDHPAVCVSRSDAQAYADWRSKRDGQPYRLPNANEWQSFVPAASTAALCRSGDCPEGTFSVNEGGSSRLGIRSAQGNVREWLDCGPGCSEGVHRGMSWRDRKDNRGRSSDDPLDASRGYDDLGFRLVRDVPRAELELR